MRFLNQSIDIFISVITFLYLVLAFPTGDLASRNIKTGQLRRVPAISGPRRWRNDSQIPNDPQTFCREESETPIYTVGDEDLGGPGVLIWNFDPNNHGNVNGTMYFFYESSHDFVPYKYTTIPPWSCVFIAVCPTFRGRIVRGSHMNLDGQKHLLGTWAEINWHANESGSTWGDISLLQGNDGAATIQSLDGLSRIKGFTLDLLLNAPTEAWTQKPTGSWCLDRIIGEEANDATRAWEAQFLDPWSVYIDNDIDPVINSNNGRFQVTFYQGII